MSLAKSYDLDQKIDLTDILGISGGYHSKNVSLTTTGATLQDFVSKQKEETRNEVGILSSSIDFSFTNLDFVKSRDNTAVKIFRTHFMKKILSHMEWISENHVKGKLSISNSVADIFKLIGKYFSAYSNDPFSSYLMAVLDGLSFENRWVNLERSDYKTLFKQMQSLTNRDFDGYTLIDKEILKLEKIGINTTPYGCQ